MMTKIFDKFYNELTPIHSFMKLGSTIKELTSSKLHNKLRYYPIFLSSQYINDEIVYDEVIYEHKSGGYYIYLVRDKTSLEKTYDATLIYPTTKHEEIKVFINGLKRLSSQ